MEDGDIAIVGMGCRLPGAPDIIGFRRLLDEGRCSVQPLPTGRWSVERFLHSDRSALGFSYTFAGGYLDSPFDFDATMFGISPREAAEIDPQQRLLLEVVYEALLDANLRRDALSGSDVGVYVGASSLDHGAILASDPASIDRYFMTGNTLSIVSNRLSHNYNWTGPSYTVDTACSSSMVALVQAISDLNAGRVETAVVAGVNMLLNPLSFVGFSRASMLSPTGFCRPFSNKADGYVRSEGALALVLRRKGATVPGSVRAFVLAAGTNNDGRTSGIALPSLQGQARLLSDIYSGLGLHPDRLAFVEAHGTGTQVGDAVEATAIGQALGRQRGRGLPIGSVKSNLGHLEPASGLAGVIKAIHALESRVLPRTLHVDELNSAIDFDELGLAPAKGPTKLDDGSELVCGVSSFGFGGSNAHVVLRAADQLSPDTADVNLPEQGYLVLSAATKESLAELVSAYEQRLERGDSVQRLAAAVDAGRELMPFRSVLAFPLDGTTREFISGQAASGDAKVCFVFSGNGAQWIGMGRAAYASNAEFRAVFDAIDRLFSQEADDGEATLRENLFADDIETKFAVASFVQPLIYVVQSALASALIDIGLVPDFVLGHSLGEIAAAEVAGAISREQAVKIIHARAACQEAVRGAGRMAVFSANETDVQGLLKAFGDGQIEIAADNGPSSVTVTGSADAVPKLVAFARKKRVAGRLMDLEYPFHSHFLDGLEDSFRAGIGDLRASAPRVPFVSTVTGELYERSLNADYWWQNFRQQVRFRQALEAVGGAGATLFVEISPRPLLQSAIAQTLAQAGSPARIIASLTQRDWTTEQEQPDPVAAIMADALANGATKRHGSANIHPFVDRSLDLPLYPWQRRTFQSPRTSEGLDVFGSKRRHPLIGARLTEGSHEWRNLVDVSLVPYLADHVVGGEIVVPGATLAEMILAVARELEPQGPVGIEDFDILQALSLPKETMREVSVRHSPATRMVEIHSRRRFSSDEWTLHARARLARVQNTPMSPAVLPEVKFTADSARIYARASETGIDYGPAFRLVKAIERDDKVMSITLAEPPEGTAAYFFQPVISPQSLDACFHSLFDTLKSEDGITRTYLPTRFRRLRVFSDGAPIVAATLSLVRETSHSVTVSATFQDAAGNVVADLDHAFLHSVVLKRDEPSSIFLYRQLHPQLGGSLDIEEIVRHVPARQNADERNVLLLRAHMRAVAHEALYTLSKDGFLDLDSEIAAGRISDQARFYVTLLCEELIAGGLASEEEGGIQLVADSGLPAPGLILGTFAEACPQATADLMLAALTASRIADFLTTGRPIEHRSVVLKQFEAESLLFQNVVRSVTEIVNATIAHANARPLSLIVSVRSSALLLRTLAPLLRSGAIDLTIAGRDEIELSHAPQQLAGRKTNVLDLSTLQLSAVTSRFDLALVNVFGGGLEAGTTLASLSPLVSKSGLLALCRPAPDPLFDFYLGSAEDWFASSAGMPVGQVDQLAMVPELLEAAGFEPVAERPDATDDTPVILVRPLEDSTSDIAVGRSGVVFSESAETDALRLQLERALPDSSGSESDACENLLFLFDREQGAPLQAISGGLLRVIQELKRPDCRQRLWLVVRDAFQPPVEPFAEAIWSSALALMNEYPERDIRLVDLSSELTVQDAAAHLIDILAKPGAEHEIQVGPKGRSVVRVLASTDLPGTPQADALILSDPRNTSIAGMHWVSASRRAPEADEIEVEVIGAGLNFRDLMLGTGLLDEDVLEGGATDGSLGFECSGRVVRTGKAVTGLQPGDLVFGVAPNTFASHTTAPASGFHLIPDGIDVLAAAGLPVAYLTAWYALIEQARLKPGETVLIHGAAGGVGLAALQIARAIGARAIGTVSTADKDALARLFGAEAVFDSRSLSFAENIHKQYGGVDVVLNSLFGEAMAASLQTLKPFGRFVELGKRDYVANTEIGLRPFRRNLSYYGVDVDQLFAHAPGVLAEGLSHLAEGLSTGRYGPLPCRVFAADDISAAFRLMQSAGHVGKIIVAGPKVGQAPDEPEGTETNVYRPGDGVQMIVGGTGGFGFATAEWLARLGARKIVVASRRGVLSDDCLEKADALRAGGVELNVRTLDVSDRQATDLFVKSVASEIGPITGVFHTAMVLDDGFASGLDVSRIEKVLAPKVLGAQNLDLATRNQPVETFVLFSSVSALFGNPGQSAYAAANGYLNGLARARRAQGLPALSIGWGNIADVGELARNTATARLLESMIGGTGLKAAEALEGLGKLLSSVNTLADPVIYYTRRFGGGGMMSLPTLNTPAFGALRETSRTSARVADVDVRKVVAEKSDEDAQRFLLELIVDEVTKILRQHPSEIDVTRPLDELGLDSLMALELRMSVENRVGVELPLVAITSVRNLHELSLRMLKDMREGTADETPTDRVELSLYHAHGGEAASLPDSVAPTMG